MRKLNVKFQRSPQDILTVGTLAEQDRRIYFEYDPAFLDKGMQLSPFKLPARPGLIEHTDHAFGPLPGLFDDSLPDGWGLLLMDRHFRRQGVDPATLSPLDRLAYLGTRTMGALTYHPPTVVEHDAQLINLYEMGHNAEDVLEGGAAEVLPALMRAGGSPGGARPKVLVGVQGDHIISGEGDLPEGFLTAGGRAWIIKFAAKVDARDAGPVEFAYSLMARAAGIDMPTTRLFELKSPHSDPRSRPRPRDVRRYFGVQRFDRAEGNRRRHVHTYANLVHTNFRIPSTDYSDVFKVTWALTRNHGDVLRLFRLMAFNIAAHNRDDHAKNFAFILDDQTGEWSLAPAYDLIYAPGPGGEHTTTVLGEGRQPTREHCLKLAAQVGLKPRAVTPLIDQVNAAINQWPYFADQACCARKVTTTIAKTLHPL
jgi:serine/threonine-protein kinase HipA